MSETTLVIVVTSGLLGLISGFLMHRSDFCITGMFRDYFLFRDGSMLRALLLLMVVSAALFELGRLSGVITLYPFPLLGVPSAANLAGGLLFGFGMVLAGGCVVGTLYKMGSGHMLSAVAFVGLLFGSALYAEFHPWWAGIAKATALPGAGVTLPQALGVEPFWLLVPLILLGALPLRRWFRQGRIQRPALAEGYIQPWKTALLLALVGVVSYLIVGMPLGITTSYAKLGATVEAVFAPEHVASLAYFQAQPLNYVPPLADETGQAIMGGAGPALDAIAAIQYPLVFGIFLGAFISALLLREFRIYYRLPAVQYLSALGGGILLGMAARMTPGCNVWHLFGGVPILANQSLLFLIGLLPGAWLGSRVLARFVIR